MIQAQIIQNGNLLFEIAQIHYTEQRVSDNLKFQKINLFHMYVNLWQILVMDKRVQYI